MPTTAEDVARAALAAVDTDAGLLRGVAWTSERYRELTSRAKFKHLRKLAELNTAAPIVAGLATVTPGSAVVTGDATSSPLWTPELIGRSFRGQTAYYEIVDVVPHPTAAVLHLASAWSESPTGAIGYKIIQRFSLLAPDARFLGVFVHMRRRRELRWRNALEADMEWPGRTLTTAGPVYIIDQGVSAEDGRRKVEFYPPSSQAESIVYSYWSMSPDLQVDDVLPAAVDLALLKAGVLVDVFRYEMAKAMRAGRPEEAAVWRNESRAQRTEWEEKIQDMVRADRGADDLTFILRTRDTGAADDPLNTTAHSDVYLFRWP